MSFTGRSMFEGGGVRVKRSAKKMRGKFGKDAKHGVDLGSRGKKKKKPSQKKPPGIIYPKDNDLTTEYEYPEKLHLVKKKGKKITKTSIGKAAINKGLHYIKHKNTKGITWY